MNERAATLKQFFAAAQAAGVEPAELSALGALLSLEQAAGLPLPWCLGVRQIAGRPMAEAAVLFGNALLFGSAGEGPPWRAAHPLRHLSEVRYFSPGEDGVHSLRLKIADLHHKLEEKPDDTFHSGLRPFADALCARLQERF